MLQICLKLCVLDACEREAYFSSGKPVIIRTIDNRKIWRVFIVHHIFHIQTTECRQTKCLMVYNKNILFVKNWYHISYTYLHMPLWSLWVSMWRIRMWWLSVISCSSLLVPPDDPVIEGAPEILLTAGISYNLTCVSRGAKPLSTIEWYKDGVIVEGAHTSTVGTPTHTHTENICLY